MKKRFLVFLIAVCFIIPMILFAAKPPAGTVRVKKTGSKKAAVSFKHKKHASNRDCKTCHKAVKSKKKAHKICRGCHKSKGGPTKCSACHK